jgi:hypothetical protein
MTFSQDKLDDRIIKNMKPNIGRALTAVDYCLHAGHPQDLDSPDYEIFWGAIRLTFDSEHPLWIDWAYHSGEWGGTQLYVSPMNKYDDGYLRCLDAASLDLWRPLIGARLNRFDILSAYSPDHAVQVITDDLDELLVNVYGQPHGLRLSFSAGSILTGVANDGDDEFGWGEAVIARPDTDRFIARMPFILWSSDG